MRASSSASTQPALLAASMARAAASTLSAKRPCIHSTRTGRSGHVPAPRSGSRRRTRRPAGSPPAFRPSPRARPLRRARSRHERRATGRVGSEHVHRREDQGVPALPVALVGCRLAQEDEDLGLRAAGDRLGVGDPVPQRQSAFELGEGLGGSQPLRRQPGPDRRCQGPGQVVGGVPVEGEPAQRRPPGIRVGVDPGLEDLGQPGVDPVRSSGIRSS